MADINIVNEIMPKKLNVVPAALNLRQDLLEQMKGKSIDLILCECGLASSNLQVRNKRLSLSYKTISHDHIDKAVKAKIDNYNKFDGIFGRAALTGYSVLIGAAGAIAGGQNTPMGMFSQVCTQALGQTKLHLDEQVRVDTSKHEQGIQMQGSVISELGQRMSRSDQTISKNDDTISQVNAAKQRAFDALLSS